MKTLTDLWSPGTVPRIARLLWIQSSIKLWDERLPNVQNACYAHALADEGSQLLVWNHVDLQEVVGNGSYLHQFLSGDGHCNARLVDFNGHTYPLQRDSDSCFVIGQRKAHQLPTNEYTQRQFLNLLWIALHHEPWIIYIGLQPAILPYGFAKMIIQKQRLQETCCQCHDSRKSQRCSTATLSRPQKHHVLSSQLCCEVLHFRLMQWHKPKRVNNICNHLHDDLSWF